MTGDRWNSSRLGGEEDGVDAEVLPCSLLGDSAAFQVEEDNAFVVAFPLVQAMHIWMEESSDQESCIQEGEVVAAAQHRSIHMIDALSEEVADPRSDSCVLALYHFEIAMDPGRGNAQKREAQGMHGHPLGDKLMHCPPL